MQWHVTQQLIYLHVTLYARLTNERKVLLKEIQRWGRICIRYKIILMMSVISLFIVRKEKKNKKTRRYEM